MKTANLTGALLDYWVARAEGTPADQLAIRQVPRTDWTICVHTPPGLIPRTLAYSTDWALGGPLIEKHGIPPVPFLEDYHNEIHPSGETAHRVWGAFIRGAGGHYIDTYLDEADGQGDTPLQAVCRAVVGSTLGDEVEDLPCG